MLPFISLFECGVTIGMSMLTYELHIDLDVVNRMH